VKQNTLWPPQQCVKESGLLRLLAEFKGEEEARPFTLKIDNKSVIQLSRNPVFHERKKHIDTRYHFMRQCVEEGRLTEEQVNTNNQLADILTKSLGRDQYVELWTRIGIVKVNQPGQA
jgi:hypothetical protein